MDEDYEPYSNNEVLKNLLGIKDKETMEQVEETELERTGEMLPDIYGPEHQLTSSYARIWCMEK